MPEQTILEVEQQEAFHRQIHEYVQHSANPELALSILFKMQFDTPGWEPNTGLAEGLGVEQQAVDGLLPYLAEVGLVRKLEEESSSDPRFKDWKWNVWRAKEVEGYLRSDLPYGPHTLVERAGLTDAQL